MQIYLVMWRVDVVQTKHQVKPFWFRMCKGKCCVHYAISYISKKHYQEGCCFTYPLLAFWSLCNSVWAGTWNRSMALPHNPKLKIKISVKYETYIIVINVTLEIFYEMKKPICHKISMQIIVLWFTQNSFVTEIWVVTHRLKNTALQDFVTFSSDDNSSVFYIQPKFL